MEVRNSRVSGQPQGEINVTPMIDILLVLLIIFMVIVPTLPNGLATALPQRSASPIPKPAAPIVVQITRGRDGLLVYKINHDAVKLNELGNQLSSILSLRPDKALFVRGDDDLNFSTVARVIDISKSAGADRIGLLTAKDRF